MRPENQPAETRDLVSRVSINFFGENLVNLLARAEESIRQEYGNTGVELRKLILDRVRRATPEQKQAITTEIAKVRAGQTQAAKSFPSIPTGISFLIDQSKAS